ncbi:MAG: hypothetical protein ACREDR_00095 [Blastocatellia bacterium]
MKMIDAKPALRGLLLLLALVTTGAFFTTFTSRRAAASNSPLFVEIGQDAIKFTGAPVVGDRVYYVLNSGPNVGQVRPAIVVRSHPEFTENQIVDLDVFLDPFDVAQPNPIPDQVPATIETALFVGRSPNTRTPGSWDWMQPTSTGVHP